MTAPTDRYWLDAKTFLNAHLKPGDRILAPGNFFTTEFSNLYTYEYSHLATVEQFQWILIHKGLTDKLKPTFLHKTLEKDTPIFANEVFVIFAAASSLPRIAATDPNLANLAAILTLPPNLRRQYPIANPLKRSLSQLLSPLQQIFHRLTQLEQQVERIERQQTVRPPMLTGKAIAPLSLPIFTNLCRAASKTVYIGQDTLLCTVLGRYLMYADSRDVGIVAHLCMNGYWEPGISLAVSRVIQPDWHCLDVGANHGYYALLMASMVKTAGKVVAIEPNPHLAQLIRQTMHVNGLKDCVTVLANAVSDQAQQTVTLSMPPGYTGNATIVTDYGTPETNESFTVQTLTIDELTQNWQHVDFIKIDVEGAEAAVWRGMQATIRNNPQLVLLLEFGASRYADSRGFLEEIVAAGFVLHHVTPQGELEHLTIDQCLRDRPGTHWDLFLSR
jgi:FkbM family methyltransferase